MLPYIYYTLYKFVLITPSKKEMPEHIANTTLSLLLSLNFLSIMYLLEKEDIEYALVFLNEKTYFVILFILILIFGYFNFIKRNKHILIKEKYDKESKMVKIVKMSLVFIYVVLSFAIPIII